EQEIVKKQQYKAEARLQSLQEREQSLEGYSSGIKNLFTTLTREGNAAGKISLLVDHLVAKGEHQPLLALALQNNLDAVVVEKLEHALEYTKLIQHYDQGRVTFLPLETVEKLGADQTKKSPDGDLQTLDRFLDTTAELQGLFSMLLKNTILVDSLEQALTFAAQQPGLYSYITPEGTILGQDGSLTVGRETGGVIELLSRKNEIHALDIQFHELTTQNDIIEQKRQKLQKLIADKEKDLQDKENTLQKALLCLQGLQKDRENLEKDVHRLKELQKINELELQRLELDKIAHEAEYATLQNELAQCDSDKEAKDKEISLWERDIDEISSSRDLIHDELIKKQIELASLNERVDSLQKSLDNRQDMMEAYINQVNRNQDRNIEAARQQSELETDIKDTELKLTTLHSESLEIRQSLDIMTKNYTATKELVDQEEEWERVLRRTLAPLQEKYNASQVQGKEQEMQLEHLGETIKTRLKSSLTDIENIKDLPQCEADAQILQTKIDKLSRRMEGYADLNLAAPTEYDAMVKKIEEMIGQRNDVVEAIDTLQQSVKKIDRETQRRFKTCFSEINQNFQDIFIRLFGGGYAELKLEDEDDLLDSGISIIAQPPGKKLQSITLLSGGEKALTAIALLVAIFNYRPSPFCFMDEVDAALDEANIDRFSKLLTDMAEKAQIIMITHSKRSLEIADIFYGVTMSDPGSSKIISLQFEKEQHEKMSA
ncbi:hypothetical protein ACFL27_23900, partial [candidate division CSSED10-310 bacterium]